jgi:SAM-dependent methyltransferase
MTMEASAEDQVAAYWGRDRSATRGHNWLVHPTARACINQRISGDPAIDVTRYWRRSFLATPAPLALSLACGFGAYERTALAAGLACAFEGYDVSPDALRQAEAAARAAGLGDKISYFVGDLNTVDLPAGRYDAIFGVSAFHHVRELDSLFRTCRRALKPGGLLFMDEYIGPSRFQSPPYAGELINRIQDLLPEHYRRSVFFEGRVRPAYKNMPLSWFEENDPSEAVRSEEIVPMLKRHFEVLDWRPYGGAVMHMLLSGTAGNFDPGADSDIALMRLLALLEEELERAGALTPEFAAVVARPL